MGCHYRAKTRKLSYPKRVGKPSLALSSILVACISLLLALQTYRSSLLFACYSCYCYLHADRHEMFDERSSCTRCRSQATRVWLLLARCCLTPIDMRCPMSVLAAQDADGKQHVLVDSTHAVVFHADRNEMFDERSSCTRCGW
jgi:hypothetical protein